jgi:HD-GYP domain-containing protein (c-di-GMP phosphodiesterase class II)
MPALAPQQVSHLFDQHCTVNERLGRLHERILRQFPSIVRIACALYDPQQDLLKTFINSTLEGQAITAYQAQLSDSPALKQLAQHAECRVIADIQTQIQHGSTHSNWLLAQGYRSSFTVPMYDQGHFLGFIFFDAIDADFFSTAVQRDLLLSCNLINMALSSDLSAVRAVIASANMARDFVNLRDFETGAHLERMARYARLIATQVASRYQLNDETIEHIYLFAPLHDIGKIGIPDHILLKPGPLTPEERLVMQTHVEKGVDLIHKVIGDFDLQHLPDSKLMYDIVACHHELMNGTGYPKGLQGDEVPIAARIITVADIFDALSSHRPYKKTWPVAAALAELERMAAEGKLDPLCVEALIARLDEVVWIRDNFTDPDVEL